MKLRTVAVALPALLLAGTADARHYDHASERPLETAQGARARTARVTGWKTPAAGRVAFSAFQAAHGAWRAIWDADTAVPLRMYGKPIPVPGAVASPDVAEAAARQLLAEQLDLLAPGASPGDFQLAANVVHGEGSMRTVSFWQTWKGARVEGAAVSFLFKNDRLFVIGSTASRDVRIALPSSVIADVDAQAAAQRWIEETYGARPQVLAVGDLVVLPVVRERDGGASKVEHHAAIPVTLDLGAPRGRWTVYVDAADGHPIARASLLRWGAGTVKYKVPVRYPLSNYADYAALYANLTVGGAAQTTDLTGAVTWTGTAATTVGTTVVGTYVRVRNSATTITGSQSLANNGTLIWDRSSVEREDAQLSAFIHANLIKEFARTEIDPAMSWLGEQLQVYVNESGSCNAYSTGDDIHFYPRSQQCENTARISDVIYHEFGHSIHNHAIIPGAGAWDGALSEGISDYLAATYTNDAGMARGFFLDDQPMRDIDPDGYEKIWPDDTTGEVHDDGEIIAGTLWDLRTGLIDALGATAGKTRADDLWYSVISRASDIPSSYVEALAGDDDDGDLSNGTPNKCVIDAAFAAHGLAEEGGAVPGTIAPPALESLTLTLTPGDVSGACPPPAVTSARAIWRLRENTSQTGTVNFATSGSNLVATLPGDAQGQVLQYQVEVTFENGNTTTFPNNIADPWYETYVGPVTVIECFDFEGDADGWTLGTGWNQGAPTGTNNSDPPTAYAGTGLLGNDLGTDDGNYEPNGSYDATSPAVAIAGDWQQVRLQYRRWLSVEDAFYDHATIAVDGAQKWINLETPAENTHHRDREWRFHDVDITGEAADGSVTLTFHLDSDQGLEFGGWNIDEVCVVAIGSALCGDGTVTAPEECDDGNTDDGDGCSASCQVEDGPGPGPDAGTGDGPDAGGDTGGDDEGTPDGGCCSAGDKGVTGPLVLGLLTVLGLARRRRRR